MAVGPDGSNNRMGENSFMKKSKKKTKVDQVTEVDPQEDGGLDELDNVLATVQTINEQAQQGQEKGKLPEQAPEQPISQYVFEVRSGDKNYRDMWMGGLWENYSNAPDTPAFLGRSYSGREHLVQEWAGGGVLLMLIGVYPDEAAGYKDRIQALGSISGMDRRKRNGWLSYLLDRSGTNVPGSGLNRVAIRKFSLWALDKLGLDHLYMRVYADDEPTKKILIKQGWLRAGMIPAFGWRNGRSVDCEIYSIEGEDLLKYYEDSGECDGGDQGEADSDPGQAG